MHTSRFLLAFVCHMGNRTWARFDWTPTKWDKIECEGKGEQLHKKSLQPSYLHVTNEQQWKRCVANKQKHMWVYIYISPWKGRCSASTLRRVTHGPAVKCQCTGVYFNPNLQKHAVCHHQQNTLHTVLKAKISMLKIMCCDNMLTVFTNVKLREI